MFDFDPYIRVLIMLKVKNMLKLIIGFDARSVMFLPYNLQVLFQQEIHQKSLLMLNKVLGNISTFLLP